MQLLDIINRYDDCGMDLERVEECFNKYSSNIKLHRCRVCEKLFSQMISIMYYPELKGQWREDEINIIEYDDIDWIMMRNFIIAIVGGEPDRVYIWEIINEKEKKEQKEKALLVSA